MKIEIKIDENCKEPKVIFVTDKMSEEVNEVIKKISDEQLNMIAGFQGDIVQILQPSNMYRIFASNSKVFAETKQGVFVLKLRLYEMEQRLDRNLFVRISNSEIINLKMIKGFDVSLVGTICVSLSNGTMTYVSRRYVAKIKQILGM